MTDSSHLLIQWQGASVFGERMPVSELPLKANCAVFQSFVIPFNYIYALI